MSLPTNCICMFKSRKEIELFNPKSTDIFRDNIINYYKDRQDSHFGSGLMQLLIECA